VQQERGCARLFGPAESSGPADDLWGGVLVGTVSECGGGRMLLSDQGGGVGCCDGNVLGFHHRETAWQIHVAFVAGPRPQHLQCQQLSLDLLVCEAAMSLRKSNAFSICRYLGEMSSGNVGDHGTGRTFPAHLELRMLPFRQGTHNT
jgi:hypothetical protein